MIDKAHIISTRHTIHEQSNWAAESIFYHIYPLGLCNAPHQNDFTSAPLARLQAINPWLDHIQSLGCNALYLGPLFESSSHGYDTADYFWVDRRLGDNQTLIDLSAEIHRRGMRLVLDAVFNHVGRDFWAFRDVLQHGINSPYRDWFHNLDFSKRSSYGDPFSYEGWDGHYELVKLNLRHSGVREHLFLAVESWIRDYEIDGLRLDVADVMDIGFLHDLSAFFKQTKPDFWLMGEVVHGDYKDWVHEGCLDSVTNYTCYKALYSSHNDHNYFEIAYELERHFGKQGLYRGLALYNFTENHDVSRVASLLKDPVYLYTLYIMLFCMPGIPSIYYGGEFGLQAQKGNGSDWVLRPALNLEQASTQGTQPDLTDTLRRLAAIRHGSLALKYGDYQPLYAASDQLIFIRSTDAEQVVVAINASRENVCIDCQLPSAGDVRLIDYLNEGSVFSSVNGKLHLDMPANWGRILSD